MEKGRLTSGVLTDLLSGFEEVLGTSQAAAEDDPLYQAIHEICAAAEAQQPARAGQVVMTTIDNWERVLQDLKHRLRERGLEPIPEHPEVNLGGCAHIWEPQFDEGRGIDGQDQCIRCGKWRP